MREYREKNGLARNREGEAVRRKALTVLRDRHRDEYDLIVTEIREEREVI